MKVKFAGVWLLLAVFIVAGVPAESRAYTATEQTAVRLDAHTALFTITSKFSFQQYALHLPIASVRNAEYGASFPDVGFALFTEAGVPYTKGETYSLVLSNADVDGTEYVVPTSGAGYFTLVTLVKLPADLKEGENLKLHMRTTTQPITLKKGTKEIEGQLGEKQLETYKTPSIQI